MITAAFDAFGNFWDINEPDSPDNAICAICGIPMFKRRSPHGNLHYVAFGGTPHRCEECRKLSASRNILDSSQIDCTSILASLFEPEIANPPKPPEGPGTKGKPRGPQPERRHKIRTLAELYSLGLLYAKDRKFSNGDYLSQMTINPQFSYMLLGLKQLGRRILQGRPFACNDNTRVIVMTVFIAKNIVNDVILKKMIAELQCPDEASYQAAKNALFIEQTDVVTGKKTYVARYDRIAVVGNWTICQSPECFRYCWRNCRYGDWACLGLLRTSFPGVGHFLPVPESKAEKNSDSFDRN